MSETIRVTHEALRRIGAAVIRAGGSNADEAMLVADHLDDANLAGHDSHGIGLLPQYVRHRMSGLVVPNTGVLLEVDGGMVLRFQGRLGYGGRGAAEAMDIAIKRCRQLGLVALSLAGAHHIGRVGAFGEQAIDANLISMHFVNAVDHAPIVAPFRGAAARFTTNPICIAIPGNETVPSFLLDMATSRIALGKARVAMNEGRPLDDGMVIEADGRPTRDPSVMFSEPLGALLPVGEHKGYGLALACELLAGLLSGGGTLQPENEQRGSIVYNMFAVLIDPLRFGDGLWMAREFDAMTAYVKATPPANRELPVLIAGEPERQAAALRRREGIPVDPTSWQEILASGEPLGLAPADILKLVD